MIVMNALVLGRMSGYDKQEWSALGARSVMRTSLFK